MKTEDAENLVVVVSLVFLLGFAGYLAVRDPVRVEPHATAPTALEATSNVVILNVPLHESAPSARAFQFDVNGLELASVSAQCVLAPGPGHSEAEAAAALLRELKPVGDRLECEPWRSPWAEGGLGSGSPRYRYYWLVSDLKAGKLVRHEVGK